MTLFAHYPEGCYGPPDDDGPHVIGLCANCDEYVDEGQHISVRDLLYCHHDCADEHSPCASTPGEYMSRAAWWVGAFWDALLRCDQRWPSDLAQDLWRGVESCIEEARDTRDNKEEQMDNQLNREQAIAFGESNAWEDMTFHDRARFQLTQECLCMPFEVFHEAVEAALGRPVWTHEFGMNRDGLIKELLGDTPAPTMQDIIEMIPEEKRLVVLTEESHR